MYYWYILKISYRDCFNLYHHPQRFFLRSEWNITVAFTALDSDGFDGSIWF